MKQLKIHGSYASDGQFNMQFISGNTGPDVDAWNLAMQVLRMRGSVSTDVMRWDVHNWDEHVWG